VRQVLLAAVLALVAFAAKAQVESNQSFPLIERGRYLATVGDCTACHTKPGGKLFAGGRAMETPFGTIVSPNITPDRETGIGAWDDETFVGAMQRGYTDEHLYPAMPYTYYTKTRREDILAIRAYLNTVEPAVNHVVANQLPFPFSVRTAMVGWNQLFFKEGEWQDRADKSAEWNRGGYLVEGLGHCGACHTPKNLFGGDENSRYLQGYALQGWFAPNITANGYNGIGRWQEGRK